MTSQRPAVVKMTYTIRGELQEVAYLEDPYSTTRAIQDLVRSIAGVRGLDPESIRFHVTEEAA